jgi:hypothetical protein
MKEQQPPRPWGLSPISQRLEAQHTELCTSAELGALLISIQKVPSWNLGEDAHSAERSF